MGGREIFPWLRPDMIQIASRLPVIDSLLANLQSVAVLQYGVKVWEASGSSCKLVTRTPNIEGLKG